VAIGQYFIPIDKLSILEASYLVFRLQPYHENFNKRIVKQPKLFFFDSGLVCALLGLQDSSQLAQHYLRGGIFESFVVSELVKARWMGGLPGNGYIAGISQETLISGPAL